MREEYRQLIGKYVVPLSMLLMILGIYLPVSAVEPVATRL